MFKSSPSSSFITVAPVKTARSSHVSFLVTPKPGKSIIFTLIFPLVLFINIADLTCCDTGATISIDLLFCMACSNTICILRILGISDMHIKTNGLSSSQACFSTLVIK